jgi:hypothetical protein
LAGAARSRRFHVTAHAQMVDDDLLDAHRAHSPIDNLSRLK